jgi:iron-sulfur cluster assembly protein
MLMRTGLPAVELKLEPQGCNGYKYTWQPVATNIGDTVIDLDEEHSLILNHSVIPYVIGSEIVIESTGFNQKLSLINPNTAGSCGCGESVNFK